MAFPSVLISWIDGLHQNGQTSFALPEALAATRTIAGRFPGRRRAAAAQGEAAQGLQRVLRAHSRVSKKRWRAVVQRAGFFIEQAEHRHCATALALPDPQGPMAVRAKGCLYGALATLAWIVVDPVP